MNPSQPGASGKEAQPPPAEPPTEKPVPSVDHGFYDSLIPRIWLAGGISQYGESASVMSWSGEAKLKAVKGGVEKVAEDPRREGDVMNFRSHLRPRSACAATQCKGRLFLLGGYSTQFGALASVLSRDKRSPTWRVETKMKSRRDGMACISFEDSQGFGVLVALGGNNGQQLVNTCEQASYAPSNMTWELDNWIEIPHMSFRRGNLCAACIAHGEDRLLYALGGFADATEVMNQVESFSWANSVWTAEPPMIDKRAMHGCTVQDGRIIVAGGTDGAKSLATVESFDRREGMWRKMVGMKYARAGLSLVCLNNKIFAIGGRAYADSVEQSEFMSAERAMARVDSSYRQGKVKEFIDVVEVYDARASRWEELPAASKNRELSLDRCNAGYCVL